MVDYEDYSADFDLDEPDDDELDELYRPRKMNSRKALAPLFLFQILKDSTSPEKHLSQQELIERMQEYPYELTLERKSVGRSLHLLADSGLGIRCTRQGAWYDPDACF